MNPDADTDFSRWIGKAETRAGVLTPELAGILGAALSHEVSGAGPSGAGEAFPPLWHWAAFNTFVPHADLGRDGHPRLGGFLPPVPLERRMWAGGKLTFTGALHIGEPLTKRSEILAVDEKSGSTGAMFFVQVAHEIEGAEGGAISEQQDIVYLAMPTEYRPPKAIPAPEEPDFVETVIADEARLFRYSAATYNAHRIHYDLPYAQDVEKYPGLVVHGPMQATLLMEAAMRHAGRAPKRFSFRGVHPMFHNGGLRLMGSHDGDVSRLCTVADAGHQGFQATIEWGLRL